MSAMRMGSSNAGAPLTMLVHFCDIGFRGLKNTRVLGRGGKPLLITLGQRVGPITIRKIGGCSSPPVLIGLQQPLDLASPDSGHP